MVYAWWAAGILLALFWLDRLQDAVRGMRSIQDISQGPAQSGAAAPHVTIVVPARNEADNVAAAGGSLLRLDYPDYDVIAVDDRSTDATGEILDRLARENPAAPLRVIHLRELPAGWLGKPHAMWLAAQQASGDWLLFSDADVVFRPDALRRAISYGEQGGADHVVLFPTNVLRGVGEKIMMAGFRLLFVMGHRPWKVADPKTDDFIGFGPFNLIRRSVYERVGTAQALRMEVIEDMKLGKLVKQHGFAQRSVFGPGLLTWHWGRGAFGLVRNLGKNFFAVMQFRWWRAVGGCVLLLILNVGPFVGLVLAPGAARVPYGVALAAIAGLYLGMARSLPISPLYFILLPVSTVLLVYTMARSMILALWHGGVDWRGTRYSLKELRKGMV